MNKPKPILIIRVKLKGEIYDRVYSIRDIENVVDLFNSMHSGSMKITIEEVDDGREKQ